MAMKQMSLDGGVASHQPMFMFPQTRELRAIGGIPADVPQTRALIEKIKAEGYASREFFFVVVTDHATAVCGHSVPGLGAMFCAIKEDAGKLSAAPIPTPDWWKP